MGAWIDSVARTIARGTSRRSFLKLVGATVAGGAATALTGNEAEAAPPCHAGYKCDPSLGCCSIMDCVTLRGARNSVCQCKPAPCPTNYVLDATCSCVCPSGYVLMNGGCFKSCPSGTECSSPCQKCVVTASRAICVTRTEDSCFSSTGGVCPAREFCGDIDVFGETGNCL